MDAPAGYRIKALDAGSDPELAERLVEFWTANGALDERTARARLGEVMCVLEAEDGGAIVGVNSAYAAEAPLVGRPFWIYRRFVLPAVDRAPRPRCWSPGARRSPPASPAPRTSPTSLWASAYWSPTGA